MTSLRPDRNVALLLGNGACIHGSDSSDAALVSFYKAREGARPAVRTLNVSEMASKSTGSMVHGVCWVGVLLGLAGCSVTMQSGVPSGAVAAPVYYQTAEVESPRPVKVAPTRYVAGKPRHVAPQGHQDEHEPPTPTPQVARPSRASGDYRQERVAHQTSTKPPRVPKSLRKPPEARPFTPLCDDGPSVHRPVAVSKK